MPAETYIILRTLRGEHPLAAREIRAPFRSGFVASSIGIATEASMQGPSINVYLEHGPVIL